MKKKLITLLFAATMILSACTPKQTDAPVTKEKIDSAEGMDAVEEENIAEEEAFTEKSTDKLSFLLNIAELRPEDFWAIGDNKVYFGQFEGIPTAYRVLPVSTDTQTIDTGEDCLLLDCDSVLLPKEYDADNKKNEGQTKRQNEWKGSDLEEWLNGNDFLGNSSVFTDVEKAAIAATRLAECSEAYSAGRWTYEDFGATNRVFLLSAAEAKNLYAEDAARAKTGSNPSWWIRSAFAEAGQGAGAVHEDGHICNNSVQNFSNGGSPALNVSLSSILFVSASKTEDEQAEKVWKMTLLDTGKTVQLAEGQTVAREDTEEGIFLTVPYICSGNEITQLSVMITDKEYTESGAQVLFYGALQDAPAGSTSGTGVWKLPLDFQNLVCGEDYYAYLIAEEVHEEQRSDYAGTPFAFLIPDRN